MFFPWNPKIFFISLVCLVGAWAASFDLARAETSERRLAILAGLEETPKGWPGFLASLPEALGPRINSSPRLSFSPEAQGVLAANRLTMALPDGQLLGALPGVAMITRVLEERTPYLLEEFTPIILAPGEPYALLASNKANFKRLNEANLTTLTFYHAGLEPIGMGDLLALSVFKEMGAQPQLTKVETLTPNYTLSDPRALVAWPLRLAADLGPEIKIVAVLTDSYAGPCAPPNLDLASQGLKSPLHDYFGFYFPPKTIQAETELLGQALTEILASPKALAEAQNNCLAQVNGSLAYPTSEAMDLLSQELTAQTEFLKTLSLPHE